MNRIVLTIIGATMLVGGIAAGYLARTQPEDTGTWKPATEFEQPTAATPPVVGLGNPEAEPSEEPPSAFSPAKRIRHGTAVEGKTAIAKFELPPSGNEKADKLSRQVEKALAGDIDELLGIAQLISECGWGMASEEQLAQRLDRMAQFQSRNPGGPAMPRRGGGGSVEYQSFEDMEATLWAQFDECQTSQAVLDETLYEQVERLAETGLPSARYLYAVWPPSQDTFALIDTLELLEYQNLALEYTWMNMQERNPLGLLAMSQSYSARRPSMFTPVNGIQSQVFLLASMKCGVDNKWLEERAIDFGQGFSRFQARNTEMPSLDEDATALAEMFCPTQPES